MFDNLIGLAQDPGAWTALIALIAMEIVLGIDNLIFVSIVSNKLGPGERDKARRLGLVSQVVPHGEIAARVASLVERILSYDSEALRLGVEALRVGPSLPLAERLDHLGTLLALNCQIPRPAR